MMRLIDHAKIPSGHDRRRLSLGVRHQKVQTAQNELLALERMAVGDLQIAFGVEEAEAQIEAPAHFHQPLMQQGLRNHDQNPFGATGQELVMNDQPRFDGLAQSHLVGEQDTRRFPPGDFMGDIELMGDRAGAAAAQAANRRCLQAGDQAQGFMAQLKQFGAIELAGKEPVLWLVELKKRVQAHLFQTDGFALFVDADIGEQARFVPDAVDGHRPAILTLNVIARGESHPCQWCILNGIGTPVAGGQE